MTNKNIDAMREAADDLAREAHTSEQRGQRMTIVRTECASLASKYVAHLAARSAENKESIAAPASAEPAQQSTMQKVHIASVPGGESESVDTPNLRELIGDVYRAGSYNESIEASEKVLIAHVARQVQAAKEEIHDIYAKAARQYIRSPQEPASTAQEKKQ
jgi:hypothetical protein